jgi:hypothetical protein
LKAEIVELEAAIESKTKEWQEIASAENGYRKMLKFQQPPDPFQQ